jgi:hypothetical protein
MSDKFKLACIEYAKWQRETKRLTRKLSEAFADCPASKRGDGKSEHLLSAYAVVYEEDGHSWRRAVQFENHDGDVDGYLAEVCPACHRAHLIIQERKVAKKQFGIAKRRISLLGRKA